MEKKAAAPVVAGGKKQWYTPYLAALSNADKVGGNVEMGMIVIAVTYCLRMCFSVGTGTMGTMLMMR
jgi:hypothetical protein